MSEMIERVAKALLAYENSDAAKQFPGSTGWDGPLMGERGREMYRKMARVAMEAMRETTDAQEKKMREVLGRADLPPTKRWHWVWHEMLETELAQSRDHQSDASRE